MMKFFLPAAFFLGFFGIFLADQAIKFFVIFSCERQILNTPNFWQIFTRSADFSGDCTLFSGRIFSFPLVFNRGVAFSFLQNFGEWLKFLQILIAGIFAYFLTRPVNFFIKYPLSLGVIFGAGASNLLDRFAHGGVVDYIFWHWGFDFPVFNFADIAINLAIFSLIFQLILRKRHEF